MGIIEEWAFKSKLYLQYGMNERPFLAEISFLNNDNTQAYIRDYSKFGFITGLAPMFSIILAGFVLELLSWTKLFVILSIALFINLAFLYRYYPETQNKTSHLTLKKAFSPMLNLLTHRSFMLYVIILGFFWSNIYSFLSYAPFVYRETYLIDNISTSILIAIVLTMFSLGNFFAGLISNYLKPGKLLNFGFITLFICLLFRAALFYSQNLSIYNFTLLSCLTILCVGIGFSNLTASAMASCDAPNGAKSSLLGFVEWSMSSIMIVIASSFHAVLQANIAISTTISLILISLYFFYNPWKLGNQLDK